MGLFDWDRLKAEEITDLYRRKVAIGESITVARVEVKEGAITLPHSHENEEMILVLSGSWRFHLPRGDVTVTTNQLLQIPQGVEHSSEALEDTVALDICAPARTDWLDGADRSLHYDPDQSLWAV
ncbi:MAG: cupin domain-containing protein [Acidobacteriota bacterium]|nr:cupin domain-containing protein [Acidobacteriota bacterium]